MSSPNKKNENGHSPFQTQADLPDVLDVLIVGGGPAGTAAAFRAKELGLAALIIDFRDILETLSQFPKDYRVVTDFHGGGQVAFPRGETLVSLLPFEDQDKDDLRTQWKAFYEEHAIPACIGLELVKLEKSENDIWAATTWNSHTKSEQVYFAKYVVLGIGRGRPFEHPVKLDDKEVITRLGDVKAYLGMPACIVGSGIAAIEAVIAISRAKTDAGDETAVYWFHASIQIPKLPKALSEDFYAAHLLTGNVKHYPGSELVWVSAPGDERKYIAVKTASKRLEDGTIESSHLEFPLDRSIIFTGCELPETFLAKLGISLQVDNTGNSLPKMLVNPFLETNLPNVFVAGDLLSDVYVETEDFEAKKLQYTQVEHPGNIKLALRDGVYVIEVIQERLEAARTQAAETEAKATTEGKKQAQAKGGTDRQPEENEEDAEVATDREETPANKVNRKELGGDTSDADSQLVEKESQPTEIPREPSNGIAGGKNTTAALVRLHLSNGEKQSYPIKPDVLTTIGSVDCDIMVSDDAYVADQHASISFDGKSFYLNENGSKTGVFLRAREAQYMTLEPGDLVRLGKQFLRFRELDDGFGFIHYDQHGKEVGRYKLTEQAIILGRQAPDVTLDADDMALSRRHLAVHARDGQIRIKDLKSINHTYLKVKKSVELMDGDLFRLGRQTFVFAADGELGNGEEEANAIETLPPEDWKTVTIQIKDRKEEISCKAGQSICSALQAGGIALESDCQAGVCGSDPIRILAGKNNLNKATDSERETLSDLCGLTSEKCRLACMATPIGAGRVKIEILKGR